MFTKPLSRPVDSLDPPIVAAEAEQVERNRKVLVTGPDPRFLCPTGFSCPGGADFAWDTLWVVASNEDAVLPITIGERA